VAVVFQFCAEFGVVFDDAVVDGCDLSCAVAVGVRVNFEGGAVGSPSGVSDAYVSKYVVEVEKFVDFVDFALVFFYDDGAVVDGGYADGVVASVFKPFK
jgi:hypothetical protein